MNLRYIVLFFTSLTFLSCQSKYESQTYRFFGDSHVKNWDIDFHFGNYDTENCGINGNVIRDIFIEHTEFSSNDIAIVQIGFNDIEELSVNNSTEIVIDSIKNRYNYITERLSNSFNQVYYLSLIPYVDCNQNKILSESRWAANQFLDSLAQMHSNIFFLSVTNEIENEYSCLDPAFSYDQVHLNDLGYQSISRALYNAF